MRKIGPHQVPALRYDQNGLVPVIAQDDVSGRVLMLAWATREALEQALDTGKMTYWSRSRGRLWTKGEESGNAQRLVALYEDCDGDAVLARVQQKGPACHTGAATCWHENAGEEAVPAGILGTLDALMAARGLSGEGYTGSLVQDPGLAASKVIEEAREVAAVVRGEDNDDSLEHEAADLLYHLLAAIRAGEADLDSVLAELAKRRK